MAIKKPAELNTKKKTVLPDPIKFLEDLVQPLDRDVMESRAMQPIMGYLGPPGHVPNLMWRPGADDVAARIWNFIANMKNINPTLLRGTRDITISDKPAFRNADAIFDAVTGKIDVLPNPSQPIEKVLRHELLHGVDRAAMESISPKLGKLFDIAIREGRVEPPPFFSGAMEQYIQKGTLRPYGGSAIVTPTRQQGQQLLSQLAKESSKVGRLPRKQKVRYGDVPVSQAPFVEQFATIGTTEPPTNWKALIQALIGIVEGKYQ